MSIWKLVLLGAVVVIASGGELVSGKKQKKEEKGYELKLKLLVAKKRVPPETLTDILVRAGTLLKKLEPKITLADSKNVTVPIKRKITKARFRNILETNKEDGINLYVIIAGNNFYSGWEIRRAGMVCDKDLLRRTIVVHLKKYKKRKNKFSVVWTGGILAANIAMKLGGTNECTQREGEVRGKVIKDRCNKSIKRYIRGFKTKRKQFCLTRST